AALLPFGILLALLWRSDLRRRLAEPGPYLACLLAALIAVPTAVANRSAPVAFQLHHGLGGSRGSPLLRELDFIGGQVAMAGGSLFLVLGSSVGPALPLS